MGHRGVERTLAVNGTGGPYEATATRSAHARACDSVFLLARLRTTCLRRSCRPAPVLSTGITSACSGVVHRSHVGLL
eukprot:1186060-Prorocentrum_minimum.AAC.1